jgi:acyl-coenzyme A thioesterase PaaI-like protein
MAVDPAPGDARVPDSLAGTASFSSAMGLEMWHEHGRTHGRVAVVPEFLAPGTDWVRVGVLGTLVDMVGGTLPTGPINPTVDLRLRLLAAPPASGQIHLVSQPVKAGRRLYLAEVLLHDGDPARPFASSTITFMNQPIVGAGVEGVGLVAQPLGAPSFDEVLALRYPSAGIAEMDPRPALLNPIFGTFLGGTQILLAELAAEHALSPRGVYRAVDLDIHFVNRSGTETVVATAEPLAGPFDEHAVRVAIRRGTDDARLVSLASVRCRPA